MRSSFSRRARASVAGDLGDLQRVRQPRAVVVVLVRDEDLRLDSPAGERPAVHDAVAVALEAGAVGVLGLGVHPPAAGPFAGGVRGQPLPLLALDELLAVRLRRHERVPPVDGPLRQPQLRALSRAAAAYSDSSDCGITRTSPRTLMKFVSPVPARHDVDVQVAGQARARRSGRG